MTERVLVILESPYRGHGETNGEVEARTRWNVDYARQCVRNSIMRNEAPIASHLLYIQPGILKDQVPEERELGIACGLAWLDKARWSVYYTDHGWSGGMLNALHNFNLKKNHPFKLRSLRGRDHVQLPTTLDEDVENLLRHYVED